jgi:hypothetical protein
VPCRAAAALATHDRRAHCQCTVTSRTTCAKPQEEAGKAVVFRRLPDPARWPSSQIRSGISGSVVSTRNFRTRSTRRHHRSTCRHVDSTVRCPLPSALLITRPRPSSAVPVGCPIPRPAVSRRHGAFRIRPPTAAAHESSGQRSRVFGPQLRATHACAGDVARLASHDIPATEQSPTCATRSPKIIDAFMPLLAALS